MQEVFGAVMSAAGSGRRPHCWTRQTPDRTSTTDPMAKGAQAGVQGATDGEPITPAGRRQPGTRTTTTSTPTNQNRSAVGYTGLGNGFAKVEGGDHKAQQPAQRHKSKDHPAMVSAQPGYGDAQGSHGRADEEGQGVGMVQRAGALGLSEMVTDQPSAGTGRGSSTSTNINRDEIDRGPQSPDHGRNCHGFPLQATPDSEHAGSHGSPTTGRKFPKARGQQILRFARAVDGTGIVADGRIADPQGRIQEVPGSEQAGRAHSVRTLILRNSPTIAMLMLRSGRCCGWWPQIHEWRLR